MKDFNEIPVLDLGAATAPGGDQPKLVQEFARAYGDVGFAYIINHGVKPELLDAVFAANRMFHDLPLAQKMAVELNHIHRGYIPINTSTDVNSKLADVTKPNQSESFMIMREDRAEIPGTTLSGPNQWPQIPGFRKTLEAYNTALAQLGNRLIRIAVKAAGADPADILPAFETPTTWLRLLHYPPQKQGETAGLYGSAPHSDFGALTILATDAVGGLEVKTPAGKWVPVPYLEGAFIVNVGDMLHRMSNGRLRSTPHRVINTSGRERYSVPFFYDPHVSTQVAPLPGTGRAIYPPIHFGDFLKDELGASYDKHKPAS